ncbi:unnamed protein product [Cochlearia groenlandica]
MSSYETLLEVILLEIIARLPLRNIARLKSVCKRWKSIIESSYFRNLFINAHQNLSPSWSLMFRTDYLRPNTEAIGFYGCKKFGLTKSLSSYILSLQDYLNLPTSRCFYVASSNGLVFIEVFIARTENTAYVYRSFVGNPVLQQWVEIPPPPEPCKATGLVTCVEDNGVVSSFKVVRTIQNGRDGGMNEWRVYVYLSSTGLWSFKQLISSCPVFGSCPSMNLNGTLYLCVGDSCSVEPGVLIAHDFYSDETDVQCRVIPLPVPVENNKHVRRCLTTSRGYVILVHLLHQRLNVWRLNNNKNSEGDWSPQEETNIMFLDINVYCFPMAMNPFDSDIIYLWSVQRGCLVSCNLKTHETIVHQESESSGGNEGCCVVNTNDSKGYMDSSRNVSSVIMLDQLVLPKWMDSVPCSAN